MTQSVLAVNQALCADAAAFIRQAEADYHTQLTEIADYLVEHETMDRETFEEAMKENS